jgi:hypothetical protein
MSIQRLTTILLLSLLYSSLRLVLAAQWAMKSDVVPGTIFLGAPSRFRSSLVMLSPLVQAPKYG